jgi:hypothetical protein
MDNPFNSLLIEQYSDADDLTTYQVNRITSDNNETIEILFDEFEQGKFAAGYRVYWANGRISYRLPNPGNGYFASERDAKLFTLGFMSCYLNWFLPETAEAIKNEIRNLSTNSLF